MLIDEAKDLQPGERVTLRRSAIGARALFDESALRIGGAVSHNNARTFTIQWDDGIVSTIYHQHAERVQRETPNAPTPAT